MTAMAQPTARAPEEGPGERQGPETRERILAVALELFTEQGYDKTSLREIAERLGITKAALYYHFRNKEDILGTFAEQMCDTTNTLTTQLAEDFSLSRWSELIDDVIDDMLAKRPLFVMFERNRAAVIGGLARDQKFLALYRAREQLFDRILADEAVPLADRVRFACSLGALKVTLAGSTNGFAQVDPEDLRRLVAEAVRDLLGTKVRPA